ncbi:MAG: peptidoglycan DD-metalloendopeptidase family protein [Candidatus Kerfeldbacteria bacterium]
MGKKSFLKIFAPARNKIIYPLLNKSTIHFVIILIALAVIANNFAIKETKAEEFGKATILGTLVTGIQDLDITETADSTTIILANYYQRSGLLTTADAIRNNSGNSNDGIITSETSAALVRPALVAGGESIIGQFRDDVIYYIVEGGDTVGVIAEKFNVSTSTILWENKLGTRDTIKPGQRLTILPQSGVSHQIKSGDTIDSIAKKYSATADDIIEFNQLADASAIEKDQILIIPGGAMPAPPAPTTRTTTSNAYTYTNIPASATNTSGTKLLWPTTGHRISQYYKWRHLAIDITGNRSQPVYASDDGVVEKAGWASGYGNHIIINHGNGIKTLYGHESKLFVKTGDSVSRGQTIGMVGSTGWSTGPHVHFEVIVNGSKVNPLTYL